MLQKIKEIEYFMKINYGYEYNNMFSHGWLTAGKTFVRYFYFSVTTVIF